MYLYSRYLYSRYLYSKYSYSRYLYSRYLYTLGICSLGICTLVICTLVIFTLGIWYDRSADGTDINCCAKSNQPDLPAILAVGDDMGKVKLYKYPAVQYKAGYIDLIGHSAHVTNVVFPLNRGLVSTGGRENSIIQWDL